MKTPASPVWTGGLFGDLHAELIALLRGLSSEDWNRPTSAGSWRVRDVAAHVLDVSVRRLSSLRDGYRPGTVGKPISSYEALVDHINRLNAEWVAALRRVSPKVIVDLLEPVGSKLAALVAALDPSGTAAVAVAWAGEEQSRVWLDIGREYTEHWHHQDQIREAAGAAPLRDARWLKPVLDISMWALPHAYRDVASETGKSVLLVAEGEGGGTWTLVREPAGWTLWTGRESDPSCRILMEALTMARLLLHRLNPEDVRGQVQVEGDGALAEPFMRARAVMV